MPRRQLVTYLMAQLVREVSGRHQRSLVRDVIHLTPADVFFGFFWGLKNKQLKVRCAVVTPARTRLTW